MKLLSLKVAVAVVAMCVVGAGTALVVQSGSNHPTRVVQLAGSSSPTTTAPAPVTTTTVAPASSPTTTQAPSVGALAPRTTSSTTTTAPASTTTTTAPAPVTVPDVIGEPCQTAYADIAAAGFIADPPGTSGAMPSDCGTQPITFEWPGAPADPTAPPGSRVELTWSLQAAH